MTQAETLIALAVEVEKLDGPDRDIDARIARAFGWSTLLVQKDTWWRPPAGVNSSLASDPPRHTASLDAGMTLVPEGWHLGCLTDCNEDNQPHCCLTENVDPCRDSVGNGATLALSTVAAALRARAASLSGEG